MGAGNVIFFKYQLKNSRGKLIEAYDEQPTAIIPGMQQVCESVEKVLIESDPGTQKTIEVSAKDGFGSYDATLVFEIPRSQLPPEFGEGDWVDLKTDKGEEFKAQIVDSKADVAILDGNHPLAGQDLTFELEVVSKRPATDQELQTGEVSS